jgi:hypothetical protein
MEIGFDSKGYKVLGDVLIKINQVFPQATMLIYTWEVYS